MSPAKKAVTQKTSRGVAEKAVAAVKKVVTKATGTAASAKKPSPRKAAPKKTVAKKGGASSKRVASKTAARRAVAKTPQKRTAPPKKTVAKKSVAKKPTVKKTPAKKPATKRTATKPGAKKTVAKKAVAKEVRAGSGALSKKTSVKRPIRSAQTAKGTPAAKKTTRGTGVGGKPQVQKPSPKTTAKPGKGSAARSGVGGKKTAGAEASGAPSVPEPPKTPLKMPAQNISSLPPRKKPPAAKPKKKVKPANLDPASLAAIKKQLQDDITEYEQQLRDLDTESFTSDQTDVSGERAGMGEDFADAGTATFDRERDLSIRNNVLDLMDQVTRALARIEEGTYGSCESCGTPIDGDRIKAFPRSLMCIDCKRREERIR